jgi:hypothetical protein
MFLDILKIVALCIVAGAASIPISFGVNGNPAIVWIGNAIGSLLSALVVIYIGNRLTSKKFKKRVSERRFGNKVVTVFEEGDDNKKILKVRIFINRHGLRVFSFLCPIFPGVLISTAAIYIFNLDKRTYKRWMVAGIIFASGAYVFTYWFAFVRQN